MEVPSFQRRETVCSLNLGLDQEAGEPEWGPRLPDSNTEGKNFYKGVGMGRTLQPSPELTELKVLRG